MRTRCVTVLGSIRVFFCAGPGFPQASGSLFPMMHRSASNRARRPAPFLVCMRMGDFAVHSKALEDDTRWFWTEYQQLWLAQRERSACVCSFCVRLMLRHYHHLFHACLPLGRQQCGLLSIVLVSGKTWHAGPCTAVSVVLWVRGSGFTGQLPNYSSFRCRCAILGFPRHT